MVDGRWQSASWKGSLCKGKQALSYLFCLPHLSCFCTLLKRFFVSLKGEAVKKLILIQSLIIYTWIMKRCIVLFITFCCAVVSNAQTNGIVTDGEKGLPLAGVNIYLQKDSVGIGVIRNDNLVKNMFI